jgi:hypothetical protein
LPSGREKYAAGRLLINKTAYKFMLGENLGGNNLLPERLNGLPCVLCGL